MKLNIRWTNSLCKKTGLCLAALLLFVVALSTAVSKSKASDPSDSTSQTDGSSSQSAIIKYDTSYKQIMNDTFANNSGLLALDNKDHRYAPEPLNAVSVYQYIFNDKGEQIMTTSSTNVCGTEFMMKHLNLMISDFVKQTGLKTIMVRNASYQHNGRIYATQFDVDEKKTDPSGAANNKGTLSSDGCYEHLSGLAVDLQLYEADKGTYPQFTGEGQYSWIVENCYKYGFVQRYTAAKQEITGVQAKPDHFRYVGEVYAKIMHDNDLALEEVCGLLKKYTYEKPLTVTTDDGTEHLAYCVKVDKAKSSTTIPLPSQPESNEDGINDYFDVSGIGDGYLYITSKVPQTAPAAPPAQTSAESQPEKTE